MWVSVHCWSAVPADEDASCTSRLPVSFCSISGHACEGKDMHRPCTSHKAAAYCEWKNQLKLCVGLQQNIGVPHTVYAHHAHTHAHTNACTHARMHARMHARTHACTHAHTQSQNSLCPLAMVNIPALWAQCYECETGAGYGSTDCCECDSHCKSESPHPGMWEGELGGKGIPLMWLYKAAVRSDFALKFIYSQLTVECTMNECSGLVQSTTSSPIK